MRPLLRPIVTLGLVFAFAPSSYCQPPSAPPAPVTLGPLLDAALANNRTMKIAEADAAIAADQARAARTHQWPNFDVQMFSGPVSAFDFTFRTGTFGAFPATGPVPPTETKVNSPLRVATFLQVQASQPLTQLWRVRLTVRQRELERDIMEERRRARAQTIASDVRRLFYAVLEAQSAVAAAEANVTLHRELLRLAQEKLAAQTAFHADVLVAQAELGRREHTRTSLRNSLATLRQQLGLLVGQDLDAAAPLTPVDDVPRTEIDLAGAQARARTQRPGLREAELRVQQAQHGVEAKRSERIPDISAVARFVGLDNLEVLPTSVTAIGLFATWQPFDWGRKRREISASTRVLAQSELTLEEARAQVRVEVDTHFRLLAEARDLVAVVELARQAANEQLTLVRVRFDAQSALRSDLLRAEAAAADAERDYRRALLQSWTAEADLQRTIGEM